VFGYIFAAVRNLDDAEELYQETSIVLWRKFAEYQPDTDFARWACKIAKFEILHFHRAQRRSRVCFNDKILSNLAEVQASDATQSTRHQELLAECVDQLSAADRQLVELCYGSRDGVKEVAQKLQRSVQTLYNSLSRVRRALFDCVRLKLTREEPR
jgi:RNA polymerase sigma-70 factor (ECF subfamily)